MNDIDMSTCFTGDGSVNMQELTEIRTMCKEGLENEIKSLKNAHLEDKKYIEKLERELRNCSQEIGYLQDQLNLRNTEAECMAAHVHSLELKLNEVKILNEKISFLKEELHKSDSDCSLLIQKLEHREFELEKSNLCIEKLERALSSVALEAECEIEGMKLDLVAMENNILDTGKVREKCSQEKDRLQSRVRELEAKLESSNERISILENENEELRMMLERSDRNSNVVCDKIEDHIDEWIKSMSGPGCFPPEALAIMRASWNKADNEISESKGTCTCEDFLDPLLSKLAIVTASDERLKDEIEKMSHRVHESEELIEQLKEELREERLKAKEEAEDLIQEMAELRYQITDMLEQECKRRACIEQASLQRIAELEAQVHNERQRSFIANRQLHETQKLMKAWATKVQFSDNKPTDIRLSEQMTSSESSEVCNCRGGVVLLPNTQSIL
ncbi:hypothetical protein H6P81_019919 [Aristolochia fimbriata]|uniref:Uncharacterized protein n=1 Tax=Aristolochia fimbriata TaxID=158543 RepID=A0AAV7DTZ0_ARIFI|nr:hypothetical protein H6P81_019919 [Aristolochia fimbriata]